MPREPGLRRIDCRICIVALVDASQEHGETGLVVVFCVSIRSTASVDVVYGEKNHWWYDPET